ncbi:MAG: acyclic terpene utilization AtuA family protein [Chloroflexi bacterium]|nr:acyclic terpene utilization AtuA family protein [Chloroflexota bacterium]
MQEIRIVSAKTHLGPSGAKVNPRAFLTALERKPQFVGIQAGTGDYGPHYLGTGSSKLSHSSVKFDLEMFVIPCLEAGVPFVLGGCPTAGTKSCVDWTLDILREIAVERQLKFKLATIYSDISKEYLLRRLGERERIRHLELPGHDLTAEDVEASTNIVAFMGWEPFIRALDTNADVIFTGRCCDDAIFSAPAVRAGFDPGIAWHTGKIIECGGMAAKPVRNDIPMVATVRDGYFLVEPMGENVRCTVESVTAHNLYERASAFQQKGPGGTLDISGVQYEQHDERTVKVSGSKFIKGQYQVLIEGAGLAGYRSIFAAGVRDPEVIRRLRDFQKAAEQRAREELKGQGDFKVIFHNYGIDGAMGEYEPNREKPTPSYEVGIVAEIVASTQTLASDVCQRLYGTMHMMMYEGRVKGEGNLATPFSPLTIEAGPVYRYTINHLLPLKDPYELFPMKVFQVAGSDWREVHHG